MFGGNQNDAVYAFALETDLAQAFSPATFGIAPSTPTFKFALEARVKDQRQFLPTRGEPKASGWDARAALETSSITLQPFEQARIPLGFRVFCPEGWWLELRPRSSSFAKKNLHCLYGVIDEQFESGLMFVCQYIPPDPMAVPEYDEKGFKRYPIGGSPLTINFGDALGQLLPVHRQEMVVEEVSNHEYNQLCAARGGTRGVGGFGSTDSVKA